MSLSFTSALDISEQNLRLVSVETNLIAVRTQIYGRLLDWACSSHGGVDGPKNDILWSVHPCWTDEEVKVGCKGWCVWRSLIRSEICGFYWGASVSSEHKFFRCDSALTLSIFSGPVSLIEVLSMSELFGFPMPFLHPQKSVLRNIEGALNGMSYWWFRHEVVTEQPRIWDRLFLLP